MSQDRASAPPRPSLARRGVNLAMRVARRIKRELLPPPAPAPLAAEVEAPLPARRPVLRVVAIGDGPIAPVELTVDIPLAHMAKVWGVDYEVFYQYAMPDAETWRSADLVLGMRLYSAEVVALAREARALGIPFVYMTDDDLQALDPKTELAQHYLRSGAHEAIDILVAEAALVLVFSQRLLEKFSRLSDRVVMVRAVAGIELFDRQPTAPRAPDQAGEIRIGYAGSATHDEDVALLGPLLAELLDTGDPAIVVETIGQPMRALEGHPRYRHFAPVVGMEAFAALQHQRDWDIGLAPLQPTPGNLAKTDNKYRTYGAAGVAGIYSRLGSLAVSVSDGRTGVLVDNAPEAWRGAMLSLIEDPALRRRMATAARADVRRRYAIPVVARAVHDLFEACLTPIPILLLDGDAALARSSGLEAFAATGLARLRIRPGQAEAGDLSWAKVVVSSSPLIDGPPRVSLADHAALSTAAWADTLRAVGLSVPRA